MKQFERNSSRSLNPTCQKPVLKNYFSTGYLWSCSARIFQLAEYTALLSKAWRISRGKTVYLDVRDIQAKALLTIDISSCTHTPIWGYDFKFLSQLLCGVTSTMWVTVLAGSLRALSANLPSIWCLSCIPAHWNDILATFTNFIKPI